jgi:hypothetical protein
MTVVPQRPVTETWNSRQAAEPLPMAAAVVAERAISGRKPMFFSVPNL